MVQLAKKETPVLLVLRESLDPVDHPVSGVRWVKWANLVCQDWLANPVERVRREKRACLDHRGQWEL